MAELKDNEFEGILRGFEALARAASAAGTKAPEPAPPPRTVVIHNNTGHPIHVTVTVPAWCWVDRIEPGASAEVKP